MPASAGGMHKKVLTKYGTAPVLLIIIITYL